MSVRAEPFAGRPIRLSRRIDLTAVFALFRMTVDRLLRGRRLIVLALLFALPSVFALIAQRYNPRYDPKVVELALIFGLIPQTILPLMALVFASGMIQDEVEEQTLTYLLIRPLPRQVIYATKLVATWAVMAGLAAIFTEITYAVIYRFESVAFREILPERATKAIALMLLTLAAYGSVFGLVSLFVRRTLLFGVPYIILMEGIFANIEFIVRKLTIMYQFRVLSIRWLGLEAEDWNIDLELAPSALWAALNLAIATAVFVLLGSLLFARREFRVKTPEST
jgi:ABC-2 type transport system permease protein